MRKPNYEIFDTLLKSNGIKAADVCRETGINSATLSNWKKGNYYPKADKIGILARFFGVGPWEFYGPVTSIMWDDRKMDAPVFEVAAGQGRINDDYGTDEYSEVKVVGDSMFPSLHDGDRLLVSHAFELSDISPSDFVVVRIDGEASAVKHIEMCSNGIWLRGENANAYTDTFYSMQDVLTIPVTIIGKAVEIISRKL